MPALLELPTDRPWPAALTYRGALLTFQLPPELSEKVREFSRGEGATLFMTLLATLEVLLQRLSRQDDFAIGSPVAGRNRAEVESIIGFFVNTLVLRSDLRASPASFRELLARVRHTTLEAYAYQDVPFEMLLGSLDVKRSGSHTPLFQVMLTLQNIPADPFRLPGLVIAPLEAPSETAKFDLNWTFIDDPAGLRGALEYSSDLYDADTAARLIDSFTSLLAAAVSEGRHTPDFLPLLSERDRDEILGAWNQTQLPIDTESTIHERFEAQARRSRRCRPSLPSKRWPGVGNWQRSPTRILTNAPISSPGGFRRWALGQKALSG